MTREPILIVDDNAMNLELLRVLLGTEPYDVRSACSAEEVLSVLETFRPRIILMDIQLPGMDGLELTRRLKEDPATSDIIILAVTAYAMKGDDLIALQAGCDGYVAKPIDTAALLALVAKHLAKGT